MARMNRDRARGGDDDFAAIGDEPTFPARYAGTCATCGQRFAVGDPIASVRVDKTSTYHHGACRYPASAYLAQHDAEFGDAGSGVVAAGPTSERCRATTRKGKPCSNTPQRGEQFCGPHLAQHAAKAGGGDADPT